jgi:hypothetical protein
MIKIDIEKRHLVQILTPVRRIYKFVIGRDIYALFDILIYYVAASINL